MRHYLLFFLVLAFAAISYPWGFAGHETIACIAEAHLSDHALQRMKPLLDGGSLKDVSVWADKIKGRQRSTSPWHYINLPVSPEIKKDDIDKYMPDENNIISRIEQDIKILKTKSGTLAEQKQALWFLVHFMGDLHMPLHVGENSDRGGNDLRVRFFAPLKGNTGHVTNMHSLWDNLIEIKTAEEPDVLCRELNGKVSRQDRLDWAKGSVRDWAYDTYLISKTAVYSGLPKADPEGLIVLPRPYFEQKRPIADRQLEKAGIRLADVLEGIFGK